MKAKVFCIGFHKTGTTSLRVALQALGYRVTGPNGVNDPDIENNVYAMADGLVEEYDAFQDNPWPIIYKTLDEKYPGSKFILTTRTPESWINSQVRHFGKGVTPMRTWIYGFGCPEGNEDVYLSRYLHHNQEVVDYFKDRPADLLIMNLTEGDGWEKLCSFLGTGIPSTHFPHANKGTEREKKRNPFRRLKRKTGHLIKRLAWQGTPS